MKAGYIESGAFGQKMNNGGSGFLMAERVDLVFFFGVDFARGYVVTEPNETEFFFAAGERSFLGLLMI